MATETTPAPGLDITIEDIGPIDSLKLTAPEGGGVVVLMGPNGAGKSTALEAIEAAATGKAKGLSVKDGAEQGRVAIGSALLKVGKTSRRSGDLEVEVMTGKHTIADLIDPGYKDRSSCDEHAIKTLAQLTGAADVSQFYDLVGGREEFDRLCPADTLGDVDVVALAGKVERALQARAREEESQATGADARADGYHLAAGDLDTTGEHDQAKLQQAIEQAVEHEATLRQRARQAAKLESDAATARDALEDAEAETSGPTVAEATASLSGVRQAATDWAARVAVAERELAKARQTLAELESKVREAETVLMSAQQTAATLEKFRAVVAAAGKIETVSEAELQAARAAVNAAHAAAELGSRIRSAIADKANCQEWRQKAAGHRKRAGKLRDTAAGTDEVLSKLVSKLGSALFVKKGRLLVKTDRGEESFWDLSDGERSEIAVTVFATHFAHAGAKGGLIPLPQNFWEGLDFAGRKRIAELMRAQHVTAITAEADRAEETSGPLRAEVFQG